MSLEDWQQHVADKRRRQKESIPQQWLIPPISKDHLNVLDVPATCGLLTSKELEITNTADVSVLLERLASAEWSSVEVTTAFCKRAVIAHQLTNCLTEVFVEKALERATQLDVYLKEHGTVIGPLHGLPISLKDQLSVKGLEATMGYAAWIGKFASEDAVLVDLLIQCGAVPYVKTNVPQTLMWSETHNNVFGRTSNPHNLLFTPGGSSGGEGALIAMHGSLLGVGSDIGGSIRSPSNYCGLYGFKPTSNRIPTYGIVNSLDGQETISTALGPLSASLSGVRVFMKAIIEKEPWRKDPDAVRKPWDENAYTLRDRGGGKQLCFGILWTNGLVSPLPPVKRALEQTKKALEKAGHKVIDWSPVKFGEILANAQSVFYADGGADYAASSATGEPMINSMHPDADPMEIPPSRRPRDPLSAFEFWQLTKERRALRKQMLDYWESSISRTGTGRPVDAVISPVAPYPAMPHGEMRTASYTMVWNSMNCPSLVIPITKVDPILDVKPPPYQFLCAIDEEIYGLYDSETFRGLPVGLQIIGRPLEEEAVLGIGEIVDSAVKEEYGRA
ncbi:general amidase [Amylocystis lapponica]|nr:general amidase [Amylocystis lapponica]